MGVEMGITKRTLIKHKELISLLGRCIIPQKSSNCRKLYHTYGSYIGIRKPSVRNKFHHKNFNASISASSTSDSDATSSHCGWWKRWAFQRVEVHSKKHLEVAVYEYMTWNIIKLKIISQHTSGFRGYKAKCNTNNENWWTYSVLSPQLVGCIRMKIGSIWLSTPVKQVHNSRDAHQPKFTNHELFERRTGNW